LLVQHLERLSTSAQAKIGGLLALSNAVGWLWFGATLMDVKAEKVMPPTWAFLLFAAVAFAAARYGPILTLVDLERRVETDAGTGLRWSRFIRILIFWGVWAYWLIGIWQLPRPRSSNP
jgi:hypothetical protein